MKFKRFIAIASALCMSLTTLGISALADETVDPRTKGYQDVGDVYVALPTAPDKNGDVWSVTPENAQYALDGAYGSIDGKTINFTSGTYSNSLIIGRPTKYDGSNTIYRHGSYDNDAMSYVDYIAYKSQSGYVEYSYYNRSVANVTFTAEEGVTLPGFNVAGGQHCYGTATAPMYDYVLDNGTWCYDTNYGYYTYANIKNIKFINMSFAGNIVCDTSAAQTVYDGFTFENCNFTTNGTASGNGQAIHYYDENNNGNVRNLVVNNCTFTNCYQGVYIQNAKGLTVTNSTFDTTGHNAIAMQGGTAAAPVNLGKITIENNTFKGIGNRVIRFGYVGSDTQITIHSNTVTDDGLTSEECMKAESLAAGIVYDISGDDWSGFKEAYNPELREGTVASIDDKAYSNVTEALTASKTDSTVVKLNSEVNIPSATDYIGATVNLNGNKFVSDDVLLKKADSNYTIVQKADAEGSYIKQHSSNDYDQIELRQNVASTVSTTDSSKYEVNYEIKITDSNNNSQTNTLTITDLPQSNNILSLGIVITNIPDGNTIVVTKK